MSEGGWQVTQVQATALEELHWEGVRPTVRGSKQVERREESVKEGRCCHLEWLTGGDDGWEMMTTWTVTWQGRSQRD